MNIVEISSNVRFIILLKIREEIQQKSDTIKRCVNLKKIVLRKKLAKIRIISMKLIIIPKIIGKSIVSTSSIYQSASMEFSVLKPTHHKNWRWNYYVSWILMMISSYFITKQSFVQYNGNITMRNVSSPIPGKTSEGTSLNILMETGYAKRSILKQEYAKILLHVTLLTVGMNSIFIPWIIKNRIATLSNVPDTFVPFYIQEKVFGLNR